MVYHFQKRWRLKFRRDPDAGRVLFIGPLVVSFDVHRRDPCNDQLAGILNEDKEQTWNGNRLRRRQRMEQGYLFHAHGLAYAAPHIGILTRT